MNDIIIRNSIITSFFKELNSRANYAILHHLNKIYSSDDDIDFIVDLNYKQMLHFVNNFVKAHDCYLLNTYMIDIDIYRFDIVFFNDLIPERIELDCACNSKGKDLLKINTSKLLDNRMPITINDNVFYKVSNSDEIDYYINKKAFKRSEIIKYLDYFKSLDNSVSEMSILNRYKKSIEYFNSIQFKMKYNFNKLLLLFNRLTNKQALVICFLGPDGSGKSTIIDKINEYPMYIYNYYFHLKPLQKKNSDTVIVENPHEYPPYSKLKSYVKLIYLTVIFNTGWIKNIFPLKIKSSLVIFDRYFDDMLVDTRRYRYGGSLAIAKFARVFIPKPDLYFILTTDPKIIYERKQEVSFEELERQVKEYRLLADNKQYFNIDVNRTPEEISYEIIHIMMEKMNERY